MTTRNEPAAYGVLAGLIVILIGVIATCSSCAVTMRVGGTPRTELQQMSASYRVTTYCVNDTAYPLINLTMQGGSAVAIDGHHLMTALHVVQCSAGTPGVVVRSSNGKRFDALIQRTWESKDIAQLHVQLELSASVGVQIGPIPAVGDSICTQVANPDFGARCGTVETIDRGRVDADIAHTAHTEHGNSGGGAYDSRGRLVGIVTQLIECMPFFPESCGGRVSSLQSLAL